jgi:hypothetical protein
MFEKRKSKENFLLESVAAKIQSYEARVLENLLMSLLDSVFAPFFQAVCFLSILERFGGLYGRRAHQEEKCEV